MHWSLEDSWAANEATLGFRDAVALDARACWSSTRPRSPRMESAEKTEMAACPDSILSISSYGIYMVYFWKKFRVYNLFGLLWSRAWAEISSGLFGLG